MIVRARDEVLVGAARAGDVDAFEVLVRRYELPMYRVALRMLGSGADAEDATQDAFVQAWQKLAGFRGESAFATWLYRVVINRCLNVRASYRPFEPLAESLPDAGGDPAEVAERRARWRAVSEAIRALPGEQRAALVLREFEGLSYAEIAQVLGITVAAVKGRVHRARLGVVDEVGQ